MMHWPLQNTRHSLSSIHWSHESVDSNVTCARASEPPKSESSLKRACVCASVFVGFAFSRNIPQLRCSWAPGDAPPHGTCSLQRSIEPSLGRHSLVLGVHSHRVLLPRLGSRSLHGTCAPPGLVKMGLRQGRRQHRGGGSVTRRRRSLPQCATRTKTRASRCRSRASRPTSPS